LALVQAGRFLILGRLSGAKKKMKFTTLGGRRFVLAMGAGLMTTALQWYGKLDAAGSTYAMVIIGTVGAYIGGSTLEAVKNGVKSE
jgi:hypothetical protein